MNETEHRKNSITDFLRENVLDIDEKTLDAYSILQENHFEILYYDNFDLPKEKLNYFASRHYEIYLEQGQKILEDLPESLVLSSGMFGGKTTLSFILLDSLLAEKRNVAMLIADVMGEDYVTARLYKGGDKRSAKRFGEMTNYLESIEELGNSEVDVIFLDEFSFLETHIVEQLQDMCLDTGKKLVLTGLNTSYLGNELPAFSQNSKILQNSEVHECYSFVPGFCEQEPLGTSTIRYVKINDTWVLDIGLLPIVVSKEKAYMIHYSPAMFNQTATYILREYPELLENTLCAPESKLMAQQNLLEELSID